MHLDVLLEELGTGTPHLTNATGSALRRIFGAEFVARRTPFVDLDLLPAICYLRGERAGGRSSGVLWGHPQPRRAPACSKAGALRCVSGVAPPNEGPQLSLPPLLRRRSSRRTRVARASRVRPRLMGSSACCGQSRRNCGKVRHSWLTSSLCLAFQLRCVHSG
jgi:hypothetical protein